jgi:chromosome segregation ATPase
MKEELNKSMENLKKKNLTEILEINSPLNQMKNTVESHSSRLEQVKDRIPGLKYKRYFLKKEREELLDKRLKICERNMQKLSNTIKIPNLQITGRRRRRGINQRDM